MCSSGTTIVDTKILTVEDGIFDDWFVIFRADHNNRAESLFAHGESVERHLIFNTNIDIDWVETQFDESMAEWYGPDLQDGTWGVFSNSPPSGSYEKAFRFYEANRDAQIEHFVKLFNDAKSRGYKYLILDFRLIPKTFDVLSLAEGLHT